MADIRKLAIEYESRCEEFDKTVGIGGYDRSKWTPTPGSFARSSNNARQVLRDISEREGVSMADLLFAVRELTRRGGGQD